MSENKKNNELKIRASYNGKEYSVKFVGEQASKINNLIINELKDSEESQDIRF